MAIVLDTEEVVDEVQYTFIIKRPEETKNRQTILQNNKRHIYQNDNILLSGTQKSMYI